jgi:hypothetical protein
MQIDIMRYLEPKKCNQYLDKNLRTYIGTFIYYLHADPDSTYHPDAHWDADPDSDFFIFADADLDLNCHPSFSKGKNP